MIVSGIRGARPAQALHYLVGAASKPHASHYSMSSSTNGTLTLPELWGLHRTQTYPSRQSAFRRPVNGLVSSAALLSRSPKSAWQSAALQQSTRLISTSRPRRPAPALVRSSMTSLRHNTPNQRRRYAASALPNDGPMLAFWIILALNTVPFLLWNYSRLDKSPTSQRLLLFLNKNFLFSRDSATARPWTYVTSGFSHIELLHFGFNMFTLNTCCKILAASTSLGAPAVLTLQVLGIVGGSAATRWWTEKDRAAGYSVGDRQRVVGADMRKSLGASGGVSACLVAASCFWPTAPINIMFIPIGVPLALFTGLYMLFDASMVGNPMSRTGHEAHVGGGITGAAFFTAAKLLIR